MKKAKRIIIISGVVAVIGLAAFLAMFFVRKQAVDAVSKDAIWNNIYIEDIDMSGMKKEEALKTLEKTLQVYQKEKVTLSAEGKDIELTMKELGLKAVNLEELVDEALSYGKEGSVWARYNKLKKLEGKAQKYDLICQVDLEVAKAVITAQVPNFEDKAVDATIKRENNKFIVTESVIGRTVDVEASLKVVEKQFNNTWEHKGPETIQLVATVDNPKVTKEQLDQIKDVLGKFTTRFSAGTPKAKNVANATKFINGTVLMPGEQMSASDTMKPRNKANGYVEAGAYLDGEVIESYGGGVCQVSTTLYNAILLAELEVVERFPHSMQVTYVKPSMDAAIAEGYKDLKFKNNQDTPIYIEGIASGGSLTFVIYGKETRPATREVTYVSEILSEEEAPKKYITTNESVGTFKEGVKGTSRLKAKLWKVVKENGVQVSKEEVNKSSYSPKKSTWNVGVATSNTQAKKLLTDAVATQNEAKIKEAISKAQALSKESQPTTTPQQPTTPETPETPENPEESEQEGNE